MKTIKLRSAVTATAKNCRTDNCPAAAEETNNLVFGAARERGPELGAAHGWAEQPWLARPTRAGWWVVWLTQNKHPETLEVFERDGEMRVYFGEMFKIEDIRDEFGGWAGPIKSPGAWDEETQPIAGDERQPPRQVPPDKEAA